VDSLSLDRTAADIDIHDEAKLTANIVPITLRNKTVLWSSSNTNVATVANGIVKAVGEGTATVAAKSDADNSKTVECIVTVKAVPVISVALDATSKALAVGEKLQLTASALPSNATVKDVVWSVSKPDVVSVSDDGLVTAKKIGAAKVKATSVSDNTKFHECVVTVSDITKVEVDNKSGALTVTFKQLPDDVLKMLFDTSWNVSRGTIGGKLALSNMVVDRASNKVTFAFAPIPANPSSSFKAVVKLRYKDGRVVSSRSFRVAVPD
jgi:uncharacterized protein YjdB